MVAAAELRKRLAVIDPERPVDRSRCEEAMRDFCLALGLQAPSFRWASNPRTAVKQRHRWGYWGEVAKGRWPQFSASDRGLWRLIGDGLPWPRPELPDRRWATLPRLDPVIVGLTAGDGRPRRPLRITSLLAADLARASTRIWDKAEADRWAEPFLRAIEAGLIGYRPDGPRLLMLVPRPVIRIKDSLLHCDDGRPAVEWDDLQLYYWRGVRVPERIGTDPEAVTAAMIAGSSNAELRRVMFERFGIERYLHEIGAELVNQDDYGTLWRTRRQFGRYGERMTVVEVANATPEPDGSHRHYFLRVPPTMTSAREAVAWTFGFERPSDYELAVQT